MLIEDICHNHIYKQYFPTILSQVIENHDVFISLCYAAFRASALVRQTEIVIQDFNKTWEYYSNLIMALFPAAAVI